MDYGFLLDEFSYIAKNMNITAAAKELNTTQPALTKRLDAAEKELGVTLIERKAGASRCIAITQAGQMLLDCALSMNHTYRTSLAAIDRLKKANIRILETGSTIKYVFRELINEANERLEEQSSLVLRFNDRIEGMPFDLLRAGRLAIALESYSWKADTRALESVPLFRMPAMLVVHKSNPLAKKESVGVEVLNDIGIITRASQADYSLRKHVHSLCEDHNIEPNLLIKGDDSLSSVAFNHLDNTNALFCPVTYEHYLEATVPFARFVKFEEHDSDFDMRLFYRDERDPAIEELIRLFDELIKKQTS